jgi:hypothetical protein
MRFRRRLLDERTERARDEMDERIGRRGFDGFEWIAVASGREAVSDSELDRERELALGSLRRWASAVRCLGCASAAAAARCLERMSSAVLSRGAGAGAAVKYVVVGGGGSGRPRGDARCAVLGGRIADVRRQEYDQRVRSWGTMLCF